MNTGKVRIKTKDGDEVEVDINFEQEMSFAREFYSKAIEGLDEEGIPEPPRPDEWLIHDADKKLSNNWEQTKAKLIGRIEHEDTPEEQKLFLKDFLRCSLSVYLDLMCSISLTFLHSKQSTVEEVEEVEVSDKSDGRDSELHLS